MNWNRLDDTECLISDVQMPGMNGIELQGKLIAQGHHFPIIFVTAFPEIENTGTGACVRRDRLSCQTV